MRTHAIVLASLALVACKSKKDGGEGEAAKTVAPVDEPAAARSEISEAQMKGALDAWLAAQNKGDFAAYSKLYADKFFGVKRVGPVTSRFTRGTWLADRERMFKKPMKVEATDPEFSLSSRSAQVTFTQRWASGTYEDVGPKRLLAVLNDGVLKIAQEEMLSSSVLRSKDDLKASSIYFMHDGMLVLHDAELPTKRGRLTVEEYGGNGAQKVLAAVNTADLADDLKKLKGKKVLVDGTCEAEITGFKIVARAVVHFMTEQYWTCKEGEGSPMEDCTPATDNEIAETLYGEGDPKLVAELSDCDGTYAQIAATKPLIVGERVNDDALEKSVRAAFAGVKVVKEQTDAEHPDWWTSDLRVHIFKHPTSGRVYASAMAKDNAGEGCGGFEASAWQAWEVKGKKLIEIGSGSALLDITGALDVDGDGSLEWIISGDDGFGTEAGLVDGATLETRFTIGYAYNDCPC